MAEGIRVGVQDGTIVDAALGVADGLTVTVGDLDGPTGVFVGNTDREGVAVGLVGRSDGWRDGPLV